MKLKFKRFLIAAFIGLLSLNIALTYKANFAQQEAYKVIKQEQTQISDSAFIISEELVMSKLQSKSQIVSLQQELHTKETMVDDSWLGERHTELQLHGTYKMGLNTKDIIVKHIDSNTGTVFIQLPKPVIISLNVPYDQIEFDKSKGWARLSMDEAEEKKFYKASVKQIEKELIKDKELMKLANTYNESVIKELLFMIPDIKQVIFE